jgi:AhpD family alkylhydroperoxidase
MAEVFLIWSINDYAGHEVKTTRSTQMIERIDYVSVNGPAIASMAKAKNDMRSIDERLRAIIELRVSQINRCAYCVDLHTTQARAAGETQQRLDSLTVWQEGPLFDDREKAAFAWAEAITAISEQGAPKRLFDALSGHFSDVQVVDLTLIIAQMNAWNRLAISFGHVPDLRAE